MSAYPDLPLNSSASLLPRAWYAAPPRRRAELLSSAELNYSSPYG